MDSLGNAYVVGFFSHNAFKITPAGIITEIIDSTGDGFHPLGRPPGIAVDGAGNAYVPSSVGPSNTFEITSGGQITKILTSAATCSAVLANPFSIAVDDSQNVYVAGTSSDNAFKVDLLSGTQIYCDSNPDNGADIAISTACCGLGAIRVTMIAGPANQVGYLLIGAGSGTVTNPPGAQGDLCLVGSQIGRYRLDAAATDGAGNLTTDILNANSGRGGGDIPSIGGNTCVPPGQAWNFQYWHRDGTNPSKFSKAITVRFR